MNIKIWILVNCGYIYEENTSKQQSVVCKFSTLIYLVERPFHSRAIRPNCMNSWRGHSKRWNEGERRSQSSPCLVNQSGYRRWPALWVGTRKLSTLEQVVLLKVREKCGSGRRRMPSAVEAEEQGGQALGVAESSSAEDQGGHVVLGWAAGWALRGSRGFAGCRSHGRAPAPCPAQR